MFKRPMFEACRSAHDLRTAADVFPVVTPKILSPKIAYSELFVTFSSVLCKILPFTGFGELSCPLKLA